ncbi:MAG: HIT domain-containing protein [Candidatus Levyibacteriota bacterium]|jgi:histidine triad (HIT) family protein
MVDCIFCKIRDGVIAKEFTYEDKDVMVFPDIHPIKPIHLLVVPKVHIEDFLEFNEPELMTKVKKVIGKIIAKQNLDKKGYRVSVNGGGAQIIRHTHFHLMGPIAQTE